MNVAAQGKGIRPAQEDYRLHKAQKVKGNHDGRGKDYKVHRDGGAIGLAEHPAEDIRFNDEGFKGERMIPDKYSL